MLARHAPLLLGVVLAAALHTASCGVPAPAPPPVSTVSTEPTPASPPSAPTATPPTPPAATARPAPPTPLPTAASVPLGQQLVAAAQAAVRVDPDQLGLVIEHPASGIRVEHAPDRRFVAASLYKVGIAYEVLRQASAGDLSLDGPLIIRAADAIEEEPGGLAIGSTLTVREALNAAIGPSSNAAAFALMRLVGRPRLNQSLVELPLRQTGVPLLVGDTALPGSPVLDPEQAVTSAEDMAIILNRLGRDELLDPEASHLFRDMLALEDPWNPISDALPPDVPILAKTGTLPGIRNIAALIGTPCGWVTLVVLTEDVDPDSAHETVGALAQSIYTVFGVRGGC